jgi:histidine triad (HIT) family protein
MEGCVFCKMILGEVPVRFVHEDEYVVAFDDIAPQAPIHTLIVPRSHHTNLGDGVDSELAAALFLAVPTVAEIKGIAATGYRVIVNAGPDANQTVPHLHVHVLGGRPMSHGMVRFSHEDA